MHGDGMITRRQTGKRTCSAIGMYVTVAAWPAWLIMLIFGASSTLAAAVGITKDGADLQISTGVYSARVSGESGLLSRMSISGAGASEDAITKMSIDLDRVGPVVKREVVQEGPSRVIAYFAVKQGDKVIDHALRIIYDADETSLTVRVLASAGGAGGVAGSGPTLEFGAGAQLVRSLDSKETIPLPARVTRSPWMRVKVTYASGATLGIVNQGPGNPYNPNENGRVGQMAYSRGGYVANGEYSYALIAEKGAAPVLASPAMSIAQAGTPAVFWQGDAVAADVSIAKADYQKIAKLDGLRVIYEIEDAFGHRAGAGQAPLDLSSGADPVKIAVPLAVGQLGWYRAYLWVEDAKQTLLPAKERLIFSLLKRQAGMGERFDHQIQTDYTIGLGLIRLGVEPQKIDEVLRNAEENRKAAEGTDVSLDFQIDGSPVGNDPKKFADVCAALFEKVQDRIPRIEIINEPNGTMQPKEYMETFLRPAHDSIKKTSPNTKILGPVLCGIGPEQARYLNELYQLGLKDVTDELTFHPYAGNFDDGEAVPAMQRLLQVIAANGDVAKPINFTEAGYFHNGWSSMPALREVIKQVVEQYAWQDAVMGIDHRHNMYYFTDSMGYYDMWLRANQLTPAAVAMRTYTGFVKGQERAQRLDFGSVDVLRAFRYPGTERQVVVMWTSANDVPEDAPDPSTHAEFTVDGPVQCFDCFGNALPILAKDGKLALEVGSYPIYLVAAKATTLKPVPENWGANVALTAMGATAEASSEQGTGSAASVIDGNVASSSSWRSLVPNQLPQSISVRLSGPTTIDRVGIWGYSPRGYVLEAVGPDGAWVTLASKREQPYRRFRAETFKAMVTDEVRLTVVDAWTVRSKTVDIAELQVFSPGAAAGAIELVNWALASNGAVASASSEMKKDVQVATMDWGAKTPKINKILLEGRAGNAIDGKRLIKDWREFYPTTWVADPAATGQQWLQIDFPAARKLSTVTVYTVAFANWTPATSGIKAWRVQLWNGKDWETADTITGNDRVSRITRLKSGTQAQKIRVLVDGTNDALGTIGIMEVEAYGPRE